MNNELDPLAEKMLKDLDAEMASFWKSQAAPTGSPEEYAAFTDGQVGAAIETEESHYVRGEVATEEARRLTAIVAELEAEEAAGKS